MELETKRATVREKRPARNGWPGPPAADPTDPGPVDLVPGIPDEPSILFEGPPVPLDAPDLPPLCPELFPGFLGGMIKATAQATETPPELAGLLGLAAVAACVQGKAVVCPSPDYREPLCLYVAPALDSGNRKTSVLMEMTRPLREWERKRADEIQPEADKAASMRKTLEARADYLRKQAAKAESLELENLTVEIEEVERKIPEIPVLPRLWAQDVTPERLGALMAENQERIALISDEAGIFEILEGRYSGGIPNLDLFLQGHAGAPVRVDRGSRKAVYLQSPCLTLALSPQPEVIRGLALKPGFRGRGLLARFLYALPPSPLGWRKLTSKPTPQSVRDAYARGLRALLDTPSVIGEDGEPVPVVFEFSDDAFSEWREFSAATERELREDGEYAQITDWAGKLPGAAARIAGLLHCVQHAGAVSFPTAISRDTVQSALEIAAILSKHALAAFGLMGADPAIEGAKRVWRWIKTSRVKSFTARECFQALKGTFGRMGELQPALAVLVERAYIAEAPREKCNVPGRPSKTYTVNPALTEEWA
ncbi:MAG: DUF3987 domain-containing protein [Candidatus Tectomicrobia bacterium]|uniref:DUF3987 domain-containing protein n=1 Tax=Tectimicrobiota bacterium TaxID=2528274 RepID=A0A932MP93_UNCTE|nr:DUF3987 domain-containing protein [Candidatus Tectomicrobia bacterium]